MKQQYELYKKLKDAGFPQEKNNGSTMVSPDCLGGKECGGACVVYIPTLSELIGACMSDGLYFSALRNQGLINKSDRQWEAVGFHNKNDIFGCVTAPSPDEAVVRLWLALNQKP